MRCPRCGNEDPAWFYPGSRGWYCRRCVRFRRILAEEEAEPSLPDLQEVDAEYELRFSLTPYQEEASRRIEEWTRQGKSVLVKAVCGAGKTELVYRTIRSFLSGGKRVGFAIPRRQVVLQVAQRMRRDFPRLKVIPVCRGYTKETEGDLIVMTTHQLYRYPGAFDCLILDEPDAYPFVGNDVLRGIAECARKGPMVALTATPDEWVKGKVARGEMEEVDLCRRPSGIPLEVPRMRYVPERMMFPALAAYLEKKRRRGRQAMVFFPTIRMARRYGWWMGKRYSLEVITSRNEGKEGILERFSKKETEFLFCTTVLERGVTFSGIDVAVVRAGHPVFSASSLVQIMGRVGRDVRSPEGDGVFFLEGRSGRAEECARMIREANASAYGAESR